MLRREVPAGATTVDTTAIDIAAALAFFGGMATVVLAAISRVWIAPALLVVIAAAPRRSTRAVAWWTVAGVAIGLIALALLVALLAGGLSANND